MEKILSFDEIKQFILGAERCWEEEDFLAMCRFTEEEQETYKGNPDFYKKTFSSSNMLISFFTDGEGLTLEYDVISASSCFFAHIDVKIDGILLAHMGIEDVRTTPCTMLELPLPGKTCKVEIFLPPLARLRIRSLTLKNASFAKAAPRKNLVISYGDSITQGYHATYPSCAYPAIFGESLEAEVINKGIGGDIFNPPLAQAGKKGRKPTIVTIAYGTNDWSKCDLEKIRENCRNFLTGLKELYPEVPLLLLLPIWRKDCEKETLSGKFDAVCREIRQIAASFPSVSIVDGLLLTPHLPGFYYDERLHPNDQGFILMGENLVKESKKLLPSLWQ